ncbi:MAG TPA: carbohydrate ABC transporter permease [Streptosporangiaceae bacterium]|jgi:multiple sugar transport system permease protein|nr:carbohydrate ABC transporter permease [Streptosporangiaceae bacterium]
MSAVLPSARRLRATRRAKMTVGTALLTLAAVYVLAPLYWLLISSTKSSSQLFATPTFLPPSHLSLGQNLSTLFSFNNGDFKFWILNSALYATLTAGLATAVSTLCGYSLAKYRFRLRRAVFGLVVGSLMVPATVLVVPIFMLESYLHLNNSYEGVILPLALYPFGAYFMSIYSADAVPDTLIDAARIDGAGELTIFWRVARPVLVPGMATLFLLSFIGTWNNYFLPLVLLGDPARFPLTVGLTTWASELHLAGVSQPLYPEVILGSLISVLPLLILFPFLQKYVARGLTFGAIAGE